MRPNSETDALIYFVLDATRLEQRVKIGFTTNLSSRLRALAEQTVTRTAPIVIALERGAMSRERELHALFKVHRLHGEWFDYDATELRSYIAALPNPAGWLADNHDLWQYAGGALNVPRVAPLAQAEVEQSLDDTDDVYSTGRGVVANIRGDIVEF